MKKNNLVVLKTSEPLIWETEHFALNRVYRCLEPVESGDEDNYMINALWFTKEEFEIYFEFAHDRVMRDWLTLGLVTAEHKPITLKEFKLRMDVHTYGKQMNNLRIGFIGLSKDNLYKFYPIDNGNKQIQLRQMYEMYLYTVEGHPYYLDNRCIQFGTFGKHISYIRK
jgi:hypothetical protein